MTAENAIQPGQVLTGPLFSEPVRVETVAANAPGSWRIGVVSQQSEQRYGLNADAMPQPMHIREQWEDYNEQKF